MSRPESGAPAEQERFWTDDVKLDCTELFDALYAMRAKARTPWEHCRGRSDADIIQLKWPEGIRDYVLIHPYILIPDVTLDVGLYSKPKAMPSARRFNGLARDATPSESGMAGRGTTRLSGRRCFGSAPSSIDSWFDGNSTTCSARAMS